MAGAELLGLLGDPNGRVKRARRVKRTTR